MRTWRAGSCRNSNTSGAVPTYSAARELLAPREDVWLFLAEPHHLSDWWPGVAGVTPDRRGLAPGARWKLHAAMRPDACPPA